jgi:hypothetical protein
MTFTRARAGRARHSGMVSWAGALLDETWPEKLSASTE